MRKRTGSDGNGITGLRGWRQGNRCDGACANAGAALRLLLRRRLIVMMMLVIARRVLRGQRVVVGAAMACEGIAAAAWQQQQHGQKANRPAKSRQHAHTPAK